MSVSDPVLCPECGWTGDRAELVANGEEYACPVYAQVVEIVD